MREPRSETALGSREATGLGLHIREMPERGMIDLRGFADDRAFRSAAKRVLGPDLPKGLCSSAAWGEIMVFWLSTDQWLIVCPASRRHELVTQLRESLLSSHAAITDVSDMRACLRIEGDGARELVMKGTSIDLLSPTYDVGACRRMLFANIAALLHVVSARPDVLDIYVFRSYADYAWDWLMTNARQGAALRLFGNQAAPGV